MKSAKHTKVVSPVSDWCSCDGWREAIPYLRNHNAMKFCIACGKPLRKGKG